MASWISSSFSSKSPFIIFTPDIFIRYAKEYFIISILLANVFFLFIFLTVCRLEIRIQFVLI